MYHSFDVDLAKLYGVNEAIILNNIAFWVAKNEANKHNCFDGKYWTFNSAKAFSALFPYMSERTIQRVIKHLIEEKLIETGNFNDDPRNRTNYYTLTEYGKEVTANWRVALRQIDVMDNDKVAVSILKDNSNSTDINNTDINSISPISPYDDYYEQFWAAYPKKVDKKGCYKKFCKIKDLTVIFPDIMRALETQKRSKQWSEENGKYIPHPSTWINQERWNNVNEIEVQQTTIDEIAKQNIDGFLL